MTVAMARGHNTGARIWSTWPSPQTSAATSATSVAIARPVSASQIRRAWAGVGGGIGISDLRFQIRNPCGAEGGCAAAGFEVVLGALQLFVFDRTDDAPVHSGAAGF